MLGEVTYVHRQLSEAMQRQSKNIQTELKHMFKYEISNIADQVGVLGQQETQHLLQSTTTTVITSKAEAAGNAETQIAAVADNQMQVALKG